MVYTPQDYSFDRVDAASLYRAPGTTYRSHGTTYEAGDSPWQHMNRPGNAMQVLATGGIAGALGRRSGKKKHRRAVRDARAEADWGAYQGTLTNAAGAARESGDEGLMNQLARARLSGRGDPRVNFDAIQHQMSQYGLSQAQNQMAGQVSDYFNDPARGRYHEANADVYRQGAMNTLSNQVLDSRRQNAFDRHRTGQAGGSVDADTQSQIGLARDAGAAGIEANAQGQIQQGQQMDRDMLMRMYSLIYGDDPARGAATNALLQDTRFQGMAASEQEQLRRQMAALNQAHQNQNSQIGGNFLSGIGQGINAYSQGAYGG